MLPVGQVMPKRNALFLFVALVTGLLAWLARDHAGHGRRFSEVMTAIERRYVEPVDQSRLFDAAMKGVFATLDAHSGFIAGSEQDDLNAVLDQEFGGVGLELAAEAGQIVVRAPVGRSPAWRAGIARGDVIEAIDGAPTLGLPLHEVVDRLRGRPGTAVLVATGRPRAQPITPTPDPTVAPTREPDMVRRSVALTRERIRTESVLGDRRLQDGTWNWWLEGEDGVALLRVVAFGERTAAEIRDALAAIATRCDDGLRGVVLDLRGNAGGLLDAAVEVCDLFLDTGVIVSTRSGSEPPVPMRATPGALLADVPVVVLVDGLTASAAEIVAACLQDSGRATIIGSRTFGKGTVQSLLPLSDGSATLKLTTAEYLRPSMASIHRSADDAPSATWGVNPAPEHQITPTRQQAEATAAWRQARDADVFADDRPPCCAAPSRAAMQPATVQAATPTRSSERLPREADTVLARALEAL